MRTYYFDIVLHGIVLSIIEPRGVIELVARIIGSNLDRSHRKTLLFLAPECYRLLPAINNSMVICMHSILIHTLT